jgi:uncharacterized membrane protein
MWFVFAVGSACFYSMLWIIGRMSRGIPTVVVTASQYAYGPILLFFVYNTVEYPWDQTWWWFFLILPFCIVPLMGWAMTYVLHHTEVTVIKPLFGLSSISTLIVASVFFGETVTAYGVAGIFLIVFGLLMLYHGRWEIWKQNGPWISLFGAFVFGANGAVIGAVLGRFPFIFALSGIAMTGHFLVTGIPATTKLKDVQWNKRTFLILLAIMTAMFGQDIFTLMALSLGPSPYVVAVKRTSILLTAVIGYVFLHERDQSLKRLLLSSGLVVLGVMLLTLF